MNITAQHLAPEKVMAFLDGELSAREAKSVSAHVEDCAECARNHVPGPPCKRVQTRGRRGPPAPGALLQWLDPRWQPGEERFAGR